MQLADSAGFVLRALHASDTATIARLAGRRDGTDMMLSFRYPFAALAVRQYLQEAAQQELDGTARYFAIESAGQLVGGINLLHIDAEHQCAELSCWVGRPFWRRGFATRAGAEVLACAFEQLHLHRVQAFHLADNGPGAKMLAKLGFVREGVMRDAVCKNEHYRDVAVCGLIASDYRVSATAQV